MGETNLMCRIFGHRLSVEINQRDGWCVEQISTCRRCGFARRFVNETPVSDRPNGAFGIDDRARDLANARRAAIDWRRKYEQLCAEQNGTKRREKQALDLAARRLETSNEWAEQARKADAAIREAATLMASRMEGKSVEESYLAAYRVLFAYLYPEQNGAALAAEGGEVGRG